MYRLINIQQKLKAPKNQRNNFGGYSYRSCEDILEAVKPLLAENKLVLILSDEIVNIDGGFEIQDKDKKITASNRVYVKATASLYDDTGKLIISTSAMAREEETKKGMDYAQLTGATSSYARKYALNGLFAIDDNKDSDATNKHGKEEPKKPVKETKSAAQELFPPDDSDIYNGLEAIEDEANLKKYFLDNKENVVSIDKFIAACSKRKEAINGK